MPLTFHAKILKPMNRKIKYLIDDANCLSILDGFAFLTLFMGVNFNV